MITPLEIGARVLAARKKGLYDSDPEGLELTLEQCRSAVPHVAAIFRALEAHGYELVSDTDRKAGMFDYPTRTTS